MNHTDTKRELRQQMLSTLRAVSPVQREAASACLRAQLAPFLNGKKTLTVGIYIPMPHEVNLLPLLQEYPQHHYAVPRCLPGRRLCFHRITNADTDTLPGAHGIPAPAPHLPVVEPQELGLIIVPGVAFTLQGDRLGYGGGYYDRYLPQCKNAQMVATVFTKQILQHIPTEPHDLRIDTIIQPKSTVI